MRGVKHYMQRCAIQGSPTTLTAVTGVYQANADYTPADKHPFSYHFEDIEAGMSLLTHKRTITDTDIINFANLTWDHFYAHTDITSLEGSIFEQRTAHGYFLLAAAAGLFVYPNKGPVLANYGLEECRFTRPVYHNDTVYVRLTCKEKKERDAKGREHPSGIVKWFVEMFDIDDELVAVATILTMVAKKSPFMEVDKASISKGLSKLTIDSKPLWGELTPIALIDHLMDAYDLAMDSATKKVTTPEKYLEKYTESLYNHTPFPKGSDAPYGKWDGNLRHDILEKAKQALLAKHDEYELFFKENPEFTSVHPVFGRLTKYEWDLVARKHYTHHFKQFGLLD
jgi:oxepin-CoA hydrolase/3-oxo-5,6-dehydrosuberyl-CoA semialdehyde dehydrogenase